jgi:hypothetical protein
VYIGHFVPAEALVAAAPSVPLWVSLVGVSFPDLLWGVLVLTGIERVEIDPDSPLQKYVRFVRYPISHSLVLTNAIACIPAALIGYVYGYPAALVFLAASISHWLLDAIVHLPDLPVLGFNGDTKVGLGLYKYGGIAFAFEYLLIVVGTIMFVPTAAWLQTLAAGSLLHAANANSSFGFTNTNPVKSSRQYALLVLVGFGVAIAAFAFALG